MGLVAKGGWVGVGAGDEVYRDFVIQGRKCNEQWMSL